MWRTVAFLAFVAVGCDQHSSPPLAARPGTRTQGITDPVLRRERAEIIRDTCAAKGVYLGYLFAGIGEAETALSHCNSEVGYGCPGPPSPTCGGDPILAGGADGPCSAEQGGLGMYQFDAGTYADTLALYGESILTLEGNAAQAVEYMIDRVEISTYIDNVSTREEAIAWINSAELGSLNYEVWIKTVTHYYNGCVPGVCSVYHQRYQKYDTSTQTLLNEFEDGFWNDLSSPEPCAILPATGATIEEDGPCFVKGGDSQYWFEADAGHGGHLIYTHTIAGPEVDNYAYWELEPALAGTYEIAVYIDPEYSESQHAKYVVTYATGTEEIEIDQSSADGFVLLGSFELVAAGEEKTGQSIYLPDVTGEPWNNGETMISFDAVRISPVISGEEPAAGGDPGPDPGDINGPIDEGDDNNLPASGDADTAGPAASDLRYSPGCGAAVPGAMAWWFGLLWIGLLCIRRTQRS